MPKYSMPDVDTLCNEITAYSSTYQGSHTHLLHEVCSLIYSRKQFSKESFNEILLGCLVYVSEKINSEYYLRRPNQQSYLFGMFTIGSSFYDKINHDWLKISKTNPLDDKYRFTYLMSYYRYIDSQKISDSLKKIITHSSLEEVHTITQTIMKRLSVQIDFLLKAKPSDKAILAAAKNIPAHYREKNGLTGSRENLMRFHEKLYKYLESERGESKEEKSALENSGLALNHSTVYALIINDMMQIEIECKKKWVSSSPDGSWYQNGSELYKECQRILNIKRTSELDHYFIKEQLSALQYTVSKIAGKQDQLKKWDDEQFKAKAFFDEFQDQLTQTINELKNMTYSTGINPMIDDILTMVSSYAATYGVTYLLSAAMRELIISQLNITSFSGMFLAPEFAIVAIFSLLLQNAIRTNIVSRMSDVVQPIVKEVLKTPLNFTYQTTLSLINFYAGMSSLMEKAEDNPQFMLALFNAPKDLISPETQTKLRYLYDIEVFKELVKNQISEKEEATAIHETSLDLSKMIHETHLAMKK